MTLEEALIDVGDKPLVKSPYSKAIKAVINASLNDPAIAVNLNQTGAAVLTQMYQLPNSVLRGQILDKPLGGVRNKDSYRTAVLAMSAFIAVIAMTLTLAMLLGDPEQAEHSSGLLETIINGVFDLIKMLLGQNGQSPSS